jgi:hypothetical protein
LGISNWNASKIKWIEDFDSKYLRNTCNEPIRVVDSLSQQYSLQSPNERSAQWHVDCKHKEPSAKLMSSNSAKPTKSWKADPNELHHLHGCNDDTGKLRFADRHGKNK